MNEMRNPQGDMAITNGRETDLTSQAKALGRDLQSKAADFSDSVTQAAKDQVSELGTVAKDFANETTGKVQSALNVQKRASADYIGSIANAVNRAAGEFESDVPQAAQYIRRAAGQMESVANAVRERDVRELVGEVQEFARREPTLFFGGALLLGFAALRFLKSSPPPSGQQYGSREGLKNMPSGVGDGAFAQRHTS